MLRFLLFLLILLLSPMANAQGSVSLSLAEVRALCLAHNRELALAATAVTGAEADTRAAAQRPNPTASMNLLSISPWSGYRAGGWKDKKMDSQLRVDQLVERGGKQELRVKGAELRLDAARSDVDDIRRQQLQAVEWTYYDLLLAQERQRLAQEAVELYGKTVAAAQLRLRAGDISLVELSRQQIERSRAENEARQAMADLESSQIALAYLIGREEQAWRLRATDTWPPMDTVAPGAGMDPAQRADVQAARARVAAAEAARELARAQRTRDVTIGLQLEHNLQNSPTNSYGFGISVPLHIWHEYEGEIARAEAELEQARQLYARTLAQASGERGQAGSTLRSAAERRRRLENGLLADAEGVAKAAEFAYAKGAMGIMDLLDARRTLRQVQVEAAVARSEHAKALVAWRLQVEYGKEK